MQRLRKKILFSRLTGGNTNISALQLVVSFGIALLRRITERFPGGELMFDIYSRLVVRMIEWMPAARATDVHMTWPIDDARDLVRTVPRLDLVDEVPFLTLPELAEHLPRARSAMLRLITRFGFARRAIRHVRYRFPQSR